MSFVLPCLRRLLNCTAGMPAEAPLGNGFDLASTASFEDRIQSSYGSVTESKFFQMVNVLRSVDEKLQEVKPGVFATKGGGTLDFTRDVPTWCNYRIQR